MLSNEYCSGSIRSIRPDEKIDKKCQMEINPRSNCQRLITNNPWQFRQKIQRIKTMWDKYHHISSAISKNNCKAQETKTVKEKMIPWQFRQKIQRIKTMWTSKNESKLPVFCYVDSPHQSQYRITWTVCGVMVFPHQSESTMDNVESDDWLDIKTGTYKRHSSLRQVYQVIHM
jgi:hypothetical protein